MTKKLSRRDFLKGTGKITAAMAAIWAVGADVPPEDIPESKSPPKIVDEVGTEWHPYNCEYRAATIISWDGMGNDKISYDGGKTWEQCKK